MLEKIRKAAAIFSRSKGDPSGLAAPAAPGTATAATQGNATAAGQGIIHQAPDTNSNPTWEAIKATLFGIWIQIWEFVKKIDMKEIFLFMITLGLGYAQSNESSTEDPRSNMSMRPSY